jgi:hypothetical protein
MRTTAPEVPVPVFALVSVIVNDRHDNPEIANLVLRATVDGPRGVVLVQELDDVVADKMKRRSIGTKDRVEPCGQGGPADVPVVGLDVRDEEGHEHVHVTAVEGQGVSGHQLSDLLGTF